MNETGYQRRLCPAYALAFAQCLPELQQIARQHGYALAVHGSMSTDLDLLACPWTEAAADAETLIEALRLSVGGELSERDTNPSSKPHGRLSWSIYPPGGGAKTHVGPYFDISVMPKTAVT